MARVSTLFAAAAATVASAQTWYGLRPTPSNPASVDLVVLTDKAVVQTTIGSVALGANEATWPDGVRCIKGFCLFTATVMVPGAWTSFVYNISGTDARVLSKSPCPGFCRDMHVDYTSGRAFVTAITEQATVVTEITGGKAVPYVDITAQVGTGDIYPGQTTHCSEDGPGGHLFVGVDYNGDGEDLIISVDLQARKVDGLTKLSVPLFKALWAKCDGSGVVGGVSFTPGVRNNNGTAVFGSVDANGAYTKGDSVGVPAGYVPTGLLTGTEDANHFLAAFFPAYTPTNSTGVSGYLWAVQPYGGSDDFISPADYYLIGAAMDVE